MKIMKRRVSHLPTVALAFLLWIGILATCAAQDLLPMEKQLHVGDSEIISCTDAKRVAIADPLVADVTALSSGEILLNAVSPGTTVLHIWDSTGTRIYRVSVAPQEIDIDKLCAEVQDQLKDPRISVRGVGNTVMLEGTVSTESESSRAEAIAKAAVEGTVFQGPAADSKAQEIKTVSRPEGDSFIIERNLTQKDTSVDAKMGLRSPKVVNLLKIVKPFDEVSVRTLETTAAIKQALHSDALTVRGLPGSVVMVEGKVGTKDQLAQIDQMLKGWVKEGKDDKGMMDTSTSLVEKITIVNAVQLDTSLARQIMVRVQVVDINRTALMDFGFDWGKVVFVKSDIPGVNSVPTVQDQPWQIGQAEQGPFALFGGGKILQFDPVGARIRALEAQNKAKVLSEPNQLVLDGNEASMLVGGEIPIPVVQSAQVGTLASVTIEYKEFGVRLRMTPVITGEDTLQLHVNPEVSSLDFVNAVQFSGFTIPALRVRRAETTVNMKDGQSLIIGGLIQKDTEKLIRQIPVLGNLPVLGELFKTRTFTNNETELIIIVTPQLVKANIVQPAVGGK